MKKAPATIIAAAGMTAGLLGFAIPASAATQVSHVTHVTHAQSRTGDFPWGWGDHHCDHHGDGWGWGWHSDHWGYGDHCHCHH